MDTKTVPPGGAGAARLPGEEIGFACGPCWLGTVLVAQGGRGVCAILIGDDEAALVDELRGRFPQARLRQDAAVLAPRLAAVVAGIETPQRAAALPLDLRGTAFQRRVWQALREIPPGRTLSYRELAARIGAPKAVRAVGHACGANPLAVAVPCHRAVRSDGTLAGYRWGLHRKRALLEREAAA